MPSLRTSLTLDLIAMALVQPRVVLPALGVVVLGGGAVTVGVLAAAGAVGGLLSSIFSGPVGRVARPGRAILVVTWIYAAAIAAGGGVVLVASLSSTSGTSPDTMNFAAVVLLGLALLVAGAADNIGAVFRTALLQAATPDHLRGRVQSVYTVVVTGGPRLGDGVTGVLVALSGLAVPFVLGGAVLALATALVRRWTPEFGELRPFAADAPVEVPPGEPVGESAIPVEQKQ